MTYEEKISEIGDYDIIIRTPIDLTNENKQEEFKFLANRIREILRQIELHEDYEDFLVDRKRLNRITDILIDRMREDTEKRNDIANKFEDAQKQLQLF